MSKKLSFVDRLVGLTRLQDKIGRPSNVYQGEFYRGRARVNAILLLLATLCDIDCKKKVTEGIRWMPWL